MDKAKDILYIVPKDLLGEKEYVAYKSYPYGEVRVMWSVLSSRFSFRVGQQTERKVIDPFIFRGR